jgi:hypothetical protein
VRPSFRDEKKARYQHTLAAGQTLRRYGSHRRDGNDAGRSYGYTKLVALGFGLQRAASDALNL